jgi:hypothetical protein
MTTNTEPGKEWEKEHVRVQLLKEEMKEFDDDPDWLRVRHELERKAELAAPTIW